MSVTKKIILLSNLCYQQHVPKMGNNYRQKLYKYVYGIIYKSSNFLFHWFHWGNFPIKADRGCAAQNFVFIPFRMDIFSINDTLFYGSNTNRPFHTDPIQIDPFIRLSTATYSRFPRLEE